MSQPVSSLAADIQTTDELPRNVAAARAFEPIADADQRTLLASVEDVAGDARHELHKTIQPMDGPYHAKQHGFGLPLGLDVREAGLPGAGGRSRPAANLTSAFPTDDESSRDTPIS